MRGGGGDVTKPSEMLFQTCAQRTFIRLGRPGFRKHDEIPCWEGALETEGFAR